MRQTLIPFGGYAFEKREDFPSSGKEGMLYLADDESKIYVFRNGEYKAYGGGGGAGGAHNDLDGINGGDRDAEDKVTFAAHLTHKQLDDVNGIRNPAPFKPINISPAAGETEIMPIFAFQTSAYLNSQGSPMINLRIQIATDEAFTQMVIDETQEGDSVVFNLDTDGAGQYRLQPNTAYFWRAMHQAENNYWSEWSDATSFHTAETFPEAIGYAPKLILPLEGAEVDLTAITLVSNQPKAAGEPVTHEASDWRLGLTPEAALLGSLWKSDMDSVNKTLISVPDLSDQPANIFHAVVRHHMKTVGDGTDVVSPFSIPLLFRRKRTYEGLIIGMKAVLTKATNTVQYSRIDGDGSPATVNQRYFDRHPIYAAPLELAMIDGQHMALFPKFWVAADSVETDTHITYTWKIAPYEFQDSVPHPAFALADTIALGKYLNSDGAVGESIPGKNYYLFTPGTGATGALNLGGARNGPNESRWHSMTVYERVMLQLLMFIEAGTMELTALAGGTSYRPTEGKLNNDEDAPYWRGLFTPYGPFDASGYYAEEAQGIWCRSNAIFLSPPATPLVTPVDAGIAASFSGNVIALSNMATGFNDVLGVPNEILFAPKSVGVANPWGWTGSGSGVNTAATVVSAVSASNSLNLACNGRGATRSRIAMWIN